MIQLLFVDPERFLPYSINAYILISMSAYYTIKNSARPVKWAFSGKNGCAFRVFQPRGKPCQIGVRGGIMENDWKVYSMLHIRQAGGKIRMPEFKVEAPFEPTGDQPEAIAQLVEGIRKG